MPERLPFKGELSPKATEEFPINRQTISRKEGQKLFIRKDDLKPFEKKIWLASPTMHGEELKYVTEAYETNWMSTVGANINEVERIAAEKAGVKYAVALAACTPALHLCVKQCQK